MNTEPHPIGYCATPFRVALFLIIALAASAVAEAHETWLSPSDFLAAVDSEIHFDLTSGMNFPALDFSILPDRVAAAQVRQRSEISKLDPPASGKNSLQFVRKFPEAGLVTAWVVLQPKTLELSAAKVAEYFEEISAPPEVRELWEKLKATHEWTETYTKCAKTFVVVGEDAPPDASWQEPVGMPLEFIPLSDPAALRKGDKFALELRANGKISANATVGLIAQGDGKRVFAKTDAAGRAEFAIDQEGQALFFAVQLQWRDSQWISTFTTLTAKAGP